MNIPNLITLCRLAAVPLVIWLILNDDMMIAFWIFFFAALSDAADGIIAKQFDMETVFGAFLDPIADKALLVGVYLTLGNEGLLPTWLVILVVFRDILIVGGALLFQTVTQSLTMQPLMISKINTVLQLVIRECSLAPIARRQLLLDPALHRHLALHHLAGGTVNGYHFAFRKWRGRCQGNDQCVK